MKLSKWIDGKKFKPAHVGYYEVALPNNPLYRFWAGRFWYTSHFILCGTTSKRILSKSSNQNLNFRGLAEKP